MGLQACRLPQRQKLQGQLQGHQCQVPDAGERCVAECKPSLMASGQSAFPQCQHFRACAVDWMVAFELQNLFVFLTTTSHAFCPPKSHYLMKNSVALYTLMTWNVLLYIKDYILVNTMLKYV